jgi:hypothetical protein
MRRKADLPSKICPVCLRPFAWRKKWEKVWDEVKYCSERCRRTKKESSFSEEKEAKRLLSPAASRD